VIFGVDDGVQATATPLPPADAQREIGRIAELSQGHLPRLGDDERRRAMLHLYGRVLAHVRSSVDDADVSAALTSAVDDVLKMLSDTEQAIVRGRFGLSGRFGPVDARPRSVDELAEQFGITADRVRVTETRAIGRLRHPNTALRLLFDLAKVDAPPEPLSGR
jgi:RNA polymerase primary sigma factor